MGDLTREGGTVTGTGVSLESTIVRTGSYAVKILLTSGVAGNYACPAQSFVLAAAKIRWYVRVTSLPATARQLCGTSSSSPSNASWYVKLNPDGTLGLFQGTSLIGTSSAALTDTSRWYRVEIDTTAGTSLNVLWIDGVAQVVGTVTAGDGVSRTVGSADTVAATYTAYFDDMAADSAALPGAGAVVMLLPVSDNSRGAWTCGAGQTTSLFDAVNNRPPAGLASGAETNTSNIVSITNSATDNCDLNLGAFTTAVASGGGGLGAGDTVNAVVAVVRNGEQIATGTKAGALKIVSNPTQSGEDAFNFGNDVGAQGAETGNWFTSFGTIQNAPSVTLGTSPVLRVGKRTATTRSVSADFMGMYVDYTPASAAARVPRAPGVDSGFGHF
jgi:hypothetical protein